MERDFTYIDDVIKSFGQIVPKPPTSESGIPAHKVYNIGNNRSEKLLDFIKILEDCLGQKAILEHHPMPIGDIRATYADITRAQEDFGFAPVTSIYEGLPKFIAWFKSYYKA
jgi:UDP-glucuronate 4-epimerase